MLKKFIISCMLTSTFAAWGYASYRIFTPEVAPVIYNTTVLESTDKMPTASAKSYNATAMSMVTDAKAFDSNTIATEETRIYYYCTTNNGDCDYVNNQIFPEIATLLDVTMIPKIEFIDVSTLAYQSSSKRKTEYGFTSFPAFVIAIKNDSGVYIPTLSLENNPAAPFTVKELRKWFQDNGVFDFN